MRTYDIINAGPNNRFCANGKIVSNSGAIVQLQNLFRNSLLTAKNELQKALSNVNGYKKEDSLLTAARDIASLAESLVQLMESKKNKVDNKEKIARSIDEAE